MKIDLKGRKAVITGAYGYICSEMALALANSKASVSLIGRNENTLNEFVAMLKEKTGNNEIYGFVGDVTKKKNMLQIYKQHKSKVGSCSILINGAGGNQPDATCTEEFYQDGSIDNPDIKSFFDLDIEALESNIRLNLISALICAQVFGRDMVENKYGNIVNISSMASTEVITRVVSYSAAKAALENLTKWLAVYFGTIGIRVNAISPGFFPGKQNSHLLINPDGSYTSRGRKIIRNTPYGRFGRAEELVSTLMYLLDDDSGFVTGTIIPVDGGFSVFSGV